MRGRGEAPGRIPHVWHRGAYFGFHGFVSRLVDDRVTVILQLNLSPRVGTPDELRPLAERAAAIAPGGD